MKIAHKLDEDLAMTTTELPPVGAWVTGTQGKSYPVLAHHSHNGSQWLTIGVGVEAKQIPLDKVVTWQPYQPIEPELLAELLKMCDWKPDFQGLKNIFGEDAVKTAWKLLSQDKKALMHSYAQRETPPEGKFAPEIVFNPGTRVKDSDNLTGTVFLNWQNTPDAEFCRSAVLMDDFSIQSGYSGFWKKLEF